MSRALAVASRLAGPASGLVLCAVAVAAAAAALAVGSAPIAAHKPVTSKYTYNEDIFPIFRTHCSACHVAGGVAPMSLVDYNEAYPWAESIKEEVVNLRMPPWHADDAVGTFEHARSLTAREVDLVMDWAWGGTPEGNRANRPEPVTLVNDWSLGAPDLILDMGTDEGLPASESEGTRVVTLASRVDRDRWVEAIDLLPGNPAIVRDATMTLVQGDSRRPLARWVPGHSPVRRDGVAFRLPAGASIELAVHYRKTWTYEGLEAKDGSVVGLYFTDSEDPIELRRLAVAPARDATATDGDPPSVTFDVTADEDLEALAVRPETRKAVIDLRVDAVRPDGAREPMLRVGRVPPEWQRRYWFEHPVSLPRGSRVEVTAIFDPADLPDDADEAMPRVWLDVVPRASGESAR